MLEKKQAGRTSKRPDVDTLSKLYAEKSARDISIMYGVSEATVRSWILRYRRELYGEAGEKTEDVHRTR